MSTSWRVSTSSKKGTSNSPALNFTNKKLTNIPQFWITNPNAETIILSNNPITSFNSIPKSEKIKQLFFDNTQIFSLENVSEFPNLERISFMGSPLGSIKFCHLMCLSIYPSLKYVNNIALTKKSINFVNKNQRTIKKFSKKGFNLVSICKNNLNDEINDIESLNEDYLSMNFINPITRKRKIIYNNTTLSFSGQKAMTEIKLNDEQIETINVLNLSGTSITDLRDLPTMPNLKEIIMNDSQFSTFYGCINPQPKLKKISYTNTPFDKTKKYDKEMVVIVFPSLRYINNEPISETVQSNAATVVNSYQGEFRNSPEIVRDLIVGGGQILTQMKPSPKLKLDEESISEERPLSNSQVEPATKKSGQLQERQLAKSQIPIKSRNAKSQRKPSPHKENQIKTENKTKLMSFLMDLDSLQEDSATGEAIQSALEENENSKAMNQSKKSNNKVTNSPHNTKNNQKDDDKQLLVQSQTQSRKLQFANFYFTESSEVPEFNDEANGRPMAKSQANYSKSLKDKKNEAEANKNSTKNDRPSANSQVAGIKERGGTFLFEETPSEIEEERPKAMSQSNTNTKRKPSPRNANNSNNKRAYAQSQAPGAQERNNLMFEDSSSVIEEERPKAMSQSNTNSKRKPSPRNANNSNNKRAYAQSQAPGTQERNNFMFKDSSSAIEKERPKAMSQSNTNTKRKPSPRNQKENSQRPYAQSQAPGSKAKGNYMFDESSSAIEEERPKARSQSNSNSKRKPSPHNANTSNNKRGYAQSQTPGTKERNSFMFDESSSAIDEEERTNAKSQVNSKRGSGNNRPTAQSQSGNRSKVNQDDILSENSSDEYDNKSMKSRGIILDESSDAYQERPKAMSQSNSARNHRKASPRNNLNNERPFAQSQAPRGNNRIKDLLNGSSSDDEINQRPKARSQSAKRKANKESDSYSDDEQNQKRIQQKNEKFNKKVNDSEDTTNSDLDTKFKLKSIKLDQSKNSSRNSNKNEKIKIKRSQVLNENESDEEQKLKQSDKRQKVNFFESEAESDVNKELSVQTAKKKLASSKRNAYNFNQQDKQNRFDFTSSETDLSGMFTKASYKIDKENKEKPKSNLFEDLTDDSESDSDKILIAPILKYSNLHDNDSFQQNKGDELNYDDNKNPDDDQNELNHNDNKNPDDDQNELKHDDNKNPDDDQNELKHDDNNTSDDDQNELKHKTNLFGLDSDEDKPEIKHSSNEEIDELNVMNRDIDIQLVEEEEVDNKNQNMFKFSDSQSDGNQSDNDKIEYKSKTTQEKAESTKKDTKSDLKNLFAQLNNGLLDSTDSDNETKPISKPTVLDKAISDEDENTQNNSPTKNEFDADEDEENKKPSPKKIESQNKSQIKNLFDADSDEEEVQIKKNESDKEKQKTSSLINRPVDEKTKEKKRFNFHLSSDSNSSDSDSDNESREVTSQPANSPKIEKSSQISPFRSQNLSQKDIQKPKSISTDKKNAFSKSTSAVKTNKKPISYDVSDSYSDTDSDDQEISKKPKNTSTELNEDEEIPKVQVISKKKETNYDAVDDSLSDSDDDQKSDKTKLKSSGKKAKSSKRSSTRNIYDGSDSSSD